MPVYISIIASFIKLFFIPPIISLLIGFTFLANSAHATSLSFNETHQIDFSGQMECGAFDDHALRATFGLEFQIFRCSKFVLTAQGEHRYDTGGVWRYKIDWAPLYDAIQRKDNGEPIIYGDDGDDSIDDEKNEAEGQTAYYDWYKNLGTRSYYLGDVPLIDAYIERLSKNNKNTIRIGRQRNFIAFDTQQTPWQDDGKFAPYSDWLVRDLYSGIAYGYQGDLFIGNVAIFSGNNPIKGDWYLRGAASPNVKTNNTGIYALKWGINPKNTHNDLQFYLGLESNILGSTWANELADGKRNNHRKLAAFRYQKGSDEQHFTILGQRTQYISGLRESSAQADDITADNPKRFRDISQYASYVGFYSQRKIFGFGYIYEEIDRFDYNIFSADNFTFHRQGLKQKSNIYYASFNVADHMKISLAYHNINNPAPDVSEIVTHYNGTPIDYENRFKLVTQFEF